MAEKLNQHFVPQFYFRQFTNGSRQINLFLPETQRLVHNAPIKGQCARHKFYGDAEFEKQLSQLENRHAESLRSMIEFVWSESPQELEVETVWGAFEATLFQKSRTELEARKHAEAQEEMLKELFIQHLKTSPRIKNRAQCVDAMVSGKAKITVPLHHTVMMLISTAIRAMPLISDLRFCILRNQTEFPFIFCDSPVVFHNSYYRNVTSRGVLGLQTPGLQIFFPLDSDTLLVLFDREAYKTMIDSFVVDLIRESDVSQLNAMQLHNHTHALYFASAEHGGDVSNGEYVIDLWNAHKRNVRRPEISFARRDGLYVDGKPVDRIYHTSERQLNIRLDLSFMKCSPIADSEFEFRHRNPGLVEEFNARLADEP